MCRFLWLLAAQVLLAVTSHAATRDSFADEGRSPLFQGEVRAAPLAYLGQGGLTPTWFAPAGGGSSGHAFLMVSSVKKDNNSCSVGGPGGKCTVENAEDGVFCSVFGNADKSHCSTQGHEQTQCSAYANKKSLCSISGKAKNSKCSAYDRSNKGQGSCSAFGGKNWTRCSVESDGDGSFCSASDGPRHFCSIDSRNESGSSGCSVFQDKGNGRCSTNSAVGDGTKCSITRGAAGTCTTVTGNSAGNPCSAHGAEQRNCSVINNDGSVEQPNGNNQCAGT